MQCRLSLSTKSPTISTCPQRSTSSTANATKKEGQLETRTVCLPVQALLYNLHNLRHTQSHYYSISCLLNLIHCIPSVRLFSQLFFSVILIIIVAIAAAIANILSFSFLLLPSLLSSIRLRSLAQPSFWLRLCSQSIPQKGSKLHCVFLPHFGLLRPRHSHPYSYSHPRTTLIAEEIHSSNPPL